VSAVTSQCSEEVDDNGDDNDGDDYDD
jgi:hypothetical protein